jgi:hypothetical protein
MDLGIRTKVWGIIVFDINHILFNYAEYYEYLRTVVYVGGYLLPILLIHLLKCVTTVWYV